MRLTPFGCSLVSVAALLTAPAFSQDSPPPRPTPPGLGCMTCTATAPGRMHQPVVERPAIVPREAAELEIALGRLRLVRDRFKIVSDHQTLDGGHANRSLQVSFHHGGPALSASYSDRQERWSLQVDSVAGAHWTREYTDEGRTLKVVYAQRPHQPIEIVVSGLSARPFKMSGLSLWHLTQQNPSGFSTCVLPSLQRLSPSLDLQRTLEQAEKIGIRGGQELDRLEPETLEQCIIDLDSSDREVRAAALEQLQQAGLAVHIPLARLLPNQLSVQQRESLERLLDRLEPRTADTPTRVAYWLSGDSAWR